MKKIISLLLVIFCMQNIFAEFDCTKNYQGKNVKNYIGQELYVIPYRNKNNDITEYSKNLHAYVGFKNPNYAYDISEYDRRYFYHFDPGFRYCNTGTEPCWLGNRTFKVINVQLMYGCEHTWLFTLVDVKNGEYCKYVYTDSYKTINNQIEYPFISITYLNWLKQTYINKQVIIGTHFAASNKEKHSFYHRLYDVDINTRNKIIYDNDYEEYTVKDIIVSDTIFQLCFILQNNKHTICCPIGLLYEQNPTIRCATRIFLKSEWNNLCDKYGKQHMIAIMQGNIIDGMTVDELHMVKGTESTKTKIDNETIIYTWPDKNGKQVATTVKNGKVISKKTTALQAETDEEVIASYKTAITEIKKQTKNAFADYKNDIKIIFDL